MTVTPPLDHPNSAAGCLSGILHRLICSRRDSVDPPDNPPSSFQHLKNITDTPPSPSLVARLMGLDSMPVHPYAPPPDSIPRSRSANSADTWTGFLSHKRAASDPPSSLSLSLSFREAPTSLKKENDDFLLLSFIPGHRASSGGGDNHVSSNFVTTKNKMRTTVERKPRNGRRDCSSQTVPSKKKRPPGPPHKNARRGEKTAEMEQQGQETNLGRRSSAYAHIKFELDHYCRSQKKSSRRKLLSDLDRRGASLRIDISKKRTGNGRMGLIDGDKKNRTKGDRHDFLEMWGVICRMAEQDAKATSWVSDDVGEVVSEIGMGILESLLSELVLELSESTLVTV